MPSLKAIFFLSLSLPAWIASGQQAMQVKKADYEHFIPRRASASPAIYALTPPPYYQHPEFGINPWDAGCTDCFELIHKRTANSRYFVKEGSEGSHFFIQQAYGRLHYRDEQGRFRSIDPHLRPAAGDSLLYRAPDQPLALSLDLRAGFTSMKLQNGLELRFNNRPELQFELRGETIRAESIDRRDARVGKDGALTLNAWPGVREEQEFRTGEVKTSYYLESAETIPGEAEWLVIEDHLQAGEAEELIASTAEGYYTRDGYWCGTLAFKSAAGQKLFTLGKPLVYDGVKSNNLMEENRDIAGYRLQKTDSSYNVSLYVSAQWLREKERVYPVTIDPVLVGVDSFTAGDMGFEYDVLCLNPAEYCSYTMDVVVPGRTTLVSAIFDAQYFSSLFGCNPSLDCLMKEAGFQIVGPCSTSPAPGSSWTCLPPEGDSSGTCFGNDLDMFDIIACVPPSCDDHVLTFEMRNFMCSCNKPPCDILCHSMPVNSWKITIEGRTVEENPINSFNFPDFTICEGDSIALHPTGQWGVPPYEYQWSPGGLSGDTIWVAPEEDVTYTSVIFDECDNTDTVSQLIRVNPAPNPLIGPFEDCFITELDAGSEWLAYEWQHSGESTQTVEVDSSGTYFVLVTDTLGCRGLSQPVTAIVNFPPEIEAFPDTIIIDEGSLALLNATSTSPGDVRFSWIPSGVVTCDTCPDPQAFPQQQTTFFVTGTENGCESPPDSIVVIVNQIDLLLPNAFTPNSDGLNDLFRVVNPITYPFYEMRIFNRWGQQVFYTDDISEGWDGTFEGKQQELGTYIWVINFRKSNSDELFSLRGDVTLLR